MDGVAMDGPPAGEPLAECTAVAAEEECPVVECTAVAPEAEWEYGCVSLPRGAVQAEVDAQQEQEMREEALRAAEAEGLKLEKSERSTGFVGVMSIPTNSMGHRFKAVRRHLSLGQFVTAEEAALAYARDAARHPSLQTKRAEVPHMTAEDALRTARDEGLQLVCTPGSKSGFKGVSGNGKRGDTFRFVAERRVDGRNERLGSFHTAEEAALAYARALGPEASNAEAAQADMARASAAIVTRPSKPGVPQLYHTSLRHLPPCTPFTRKEVLRHADAEGISLYRSSSTASGFEGVQRDKRGDCTHRPFMAYLRKPKNRSLGSFATAEEAALCYARARAADPGAK